MSMPLSEKSILLKGPNGLFTQSIGLIDRRMAIDKLLVGQYLVPLFI